MTPLRKRANALETQFARQAELEFRAKVLCGKMIGRWAGYKMGVDDVEAYAHNIAMQQVVEPHRLLDLLRQDFSAAGMDVSEAELNSQMHTFLDSASVEIATRG
ncbi:ATPase inhibitor subunit zeta [Rhizobium sp. G187]|uniref:ATPase inhibitor subunit zeta n=1 Tax=Rhizobium sp. G187 TaxID=3451352 RepID=UPI003EE65A8E